MINATDSKGTFYILNKKDRTPIIFIHGVGLDHSIWDPQINEFDNKEKFDKSKPVTQWERQNTLDC